MLCPLFLHLMFDTTLIWFFFFDFGCKTGTMEVCIWCIQVVQYYSLCTYADFTWFSLSEVVHTRCFSYDAYLVIRTT